MVMNLPQADLKEPMSDVFLHCIDCLSQLLGNRLATKRFHVKVVGSCWENQERNNCHFAVLRLHSNHHS